MLSKATLHALRLYNSRWIHVRGGSWLCCCDSAVGSSGVEGVTPVSRGGPEDEDMWSRFELEPLSIFGYANEFALLIAASVLYRSRHMCWARGLLRAAREQAVSWVKNTILGRCEERKWVRTVCVLFLAGPSIKGTRNADHWFKFIAIQRISCVLFEVLCTPVRAWRQFTALRLV